MTERFLSTEPITTSLQYNDVSKVKNGRCPRGMSKPNIGRHAAAVTNRMTFAQAYAHILVHPTATYQTTGNRKSFTAKATTAAKGDH